MVIITGVRKCIISLQFFDTVGWAARRASGLSEWLGAGVVICLERGADLHMAQLMPLPLTISCFSKIQIGFTFLVPAHPGSLGQRAVKRVCVCVRKCIMEEQFCVGCICSVGDSQGQSALGVKSAVYSWFVKTLLCRR